MPKVTKHQKIDMLRKDAQHRLNGALAWRKRADLYLKDEIPDEDIDAQMLFILGSLVSEILLLRADMAVLQIDQLDPPSDLVQPNGRI